MFGIQSLSNPFSSSQGTTHNIHPICVARTPRSWQQILVKSEDFDFEWDENSHKSGNLNLSLVSHFQDITLAAVAGRIEAIFVGRDIFYKFGQPCKNPSYRRGDSIEETFHMSLTAFNRIFKKIGVIYNSKEAYDAACEEGDPFHGKLYLRYYDRMAHIPFYLRNDAVADKLFPNTRKVPVKNKLAFSCRTQNTHPQEPDRDSPQLLVEPSKNPGSSTKLLNGISGNYIEKFRKSITSLKDNLLLGSRARATPSPETNEKEEKTRDTSGSQVSPSTVIPDVTSKKLASRRDDKETVTSRHANTRRKEEKKVPAHKEPSPLVQEMLSIWKNVVGKLIHGGSANTLRSDMPKEMESALDTHFQGDINEWLKFCREKIVTSRMLMGEIEGSRFYGNGAYLSWTLKNIEKIKNGELDTNRVIPKTEAELQIEARQRELIDQRQTLLNRKEGLHAEIHQSREAALRKAVAETSEEDKTKLFPEFVKDQETKGHKVEASDSPTPWQGLSLLDRLMWESTLADFVRPLLFSEDIDVVVQQKLLEERVEERLGEITSALAALSVQKEALGASPCAKEDAAAASSLNAPQQSSSAETVTSQDAAVPLEHQPASEDLLPEDDFASEDDGREELKDPFEDELFETRQEIFDDEWIAQEYGTQDNPRDYVEETMYSQDNPRERMAA